MARAKDRNSGRFRIYVDDRTGVEYGFIPITSYPNAYTRESGKPVTDGGLKVSPTDYDTPPPSKQSLGGEGDISGDPRPDSDFSTPSNVYIVPSNSRNKVIYVNSSTSIAWNTDPVVCVAGSNRSQVMSVNPQIVRGQQGQQIALECVGSSITLLNGSGITVDFNQPRVVMTSGGVANLLYNATDNTWHMTTFNPTGGF